MSENKGGTFSFHPISDKAWKQQIQYELLGADYNETMITESAEGIKIKPFYTASDLPNSPQIASQTAHSFLISFEIYANQANMANEKALWCIEKGCDKLIFLVQEAIEDPAYLLANIPSHIHVSLQLQKPGESQIKAFAHYLKKTKNPLWTCTTDPLHHFIKNGSWNTSQKEDLKLLTVLSEHSPYPTLSIDARPFQESGANMAQQLAYALSHFIEYGSLLSDHQLLKRIEKVHFYLQSSNDFLLEICKLKAFHLLWEQICETFQIKLPYSLSSEGGLIEKTLFSSHTNSIRNSSQILAAVLGGAHEIVCTPYDKIFKKSHSFSDRLAINQALILKHECNLKNVQDPMSGSYAVERISYEMAEKALEILKKTEQEGGLIASFKSHDIQKQISSQYQKKLQQYQQNKRTLIGGNHLLHQENITLEKYPFIKKEVKKKEVPPLISKRFAMEWEQEIIQTSHES